ncbi:MAG: hypothetical protein AAB490_01595 [Patescibacteria group bacterium]
MRSRIVRTMLLLFFTIGATLLAFTGTSFADADTTALFAVDENTAVASGSGKFVVKNEDLKIQVDGKDWKIGESTKLDIFNGDKRISLDSLRDLGSLLKAKATLICTYDKSQIGDPVIKEGVLHLYD